MIAVLFGFSLTILATLQPLMAQGRQLSLADILIALRSKKAEIDEKNRILADAVKERGITFSLTPEIEKELDSTGARIELIGAIRSKAVELSASVVQMPKIQTVKEQPPQPMPVSTPQDFAFFRGRALSNIKNGEMDAGVADLGKALEFKPTDSGTIFDRGLVFAKQGKVDLAHADLDKVIELDPKNAAAFAARAQFFENEGKVDHAIIDYDKAAELDVSNDVAKSAAIRLRLSIAAKKVEPGPALVEKKAPATVLSVGPLNPYATELQPPVYSAMDRRMNIFGRVTVQIELDETGKVLSAKATDGAKSLRLSAEDAVRRSKFRPVKSGTVPVRATGFIIFNFVNQ